MAELDFSFCSTAEYNASRENRIMEHEFVIGALYTAMFSLARGQYEAATLPTRVTALTDRSNRLRVQFQALNEDLQPLVYMHSYFDDGFIDPIDVNTYISKQRVIGAYFKGYDEGIDWNGLSLAEPISRVVLEDMLVTT